MEYDADNIFAKIIRKELPADIVYEDDNALAFRDISPAAPVHVLVVPKGEYVSFDDFVSKTGPEEAAAFFRTIRSIAEEQGLSQSGYRLITNHGAEACQTVLHFHVHILGGKPLGGLVAGDTLHR